jgi:hypothetical protein
MTQQLDKISLVPAEQPRTPAVTPLDMLGRAVEAGADIEVLEKLMALSERWEANQAKKAFNDAIASAKAKIPPIIKNRVVDFTSQKGRTHYKHEDMAEIARTVDPILSEFGLSYRYRASSNLNEPVCVTCILSHRAGHSEETTLTAGRDETGNKNIIQGVGSTITFLQRYSLKVALGLAASNDDDGRASGGTRGKISPEKVSELATMCEAVAPGFDKSFCDYFKIAAISDLSATEFQRAKVAISKKRSAK